MGTQGASSKPPVPISLRNAALLPQHCAGFWTETTRTDLFLSFVGFVGIRYKHPSTESSPELAAKYSSAGMEEKSAQRVSKGILAAAFPAKGAGHSLQSSPRVK